MTKSVDIGSALNYQYVNLLNITPTETEPTWAYMGPGITDISPDRAEKTDETEDYSTGGNTVTTVIGVNKSTTITGTRRIGDDFQDFVESLEECFGPERETQYRIVHPTGKIIEEDVTVTGIKFSGPNGAASEKQAIECVLSRNDTPRIIQQPKGMHLPQTLTVEDVTVTVGGVAQVTPTVTPETASDWCVYAIGDPDIAKVDGTGKVTGVKAGETYLTIRCAAKPAVRTSVKVTVSAAG